MAPRGIGTMVAMLFAGPARRMRVDQRQLMAFGLVLLGWTLHDMSDVDARRVRRRSW